MENYEAYIKICFDNLQSALRKDGIKSRAELNSVLGTQNLDFHGIFRDIENEKAKKSIEVRNVEKKNATLKSAIKMLEEKLAMSEQYKENEIREIKQEYTEAEQELHLKYLTAMKENERIKKDNERVKDELKMMQSKYDELKASKKTEIQKLNDQYEAKLRELDLNEAQSKILTKPEKQGLNDTEIAKLIERHYEENKSLQDAVKELIKNNTKDQQEQLSRKAKEAESENEMIIKLKEQNAKLKKKLKDIHVYYKLFKHTQSMQCKY